jgi:hypothetical protein
MSALVDELKKHWVHRAAAELTTLQSRLEAVKAERDAARFALKGAETEAGYLAGKVERTQAAAEAHVEALREALEDMVNEFEATEDEDCYCSACKSVRKARAALKGEPGK